MTTSQSRTDQFIDRMGFVADEDRLPRIAGRVLGLLLLAEETLSLDDIAGRLQVSRGSVSANTRLLESLGAIERVSIRGVRRDHYRATAQPWAGMLRQINRQFGDRVTMLQETHRTLAERHPARRRLTQLETFYRVVGRHLDRALAEIDGSATR